MAVRGKRTAAAPATYTRRDISAALAGLMEHGGEMMRRPGGRWCCAHCGIPFTDADDALVAGMLASGAVLAPGRLASGTPYHIELRDWVRA